MLKAAIREEVRLLMEEAVINIRIPKDSSRIPLSK